MRSAQQSSTSVDDAHRTETAEGPSDSENSALRPLLTFLRRPVFTSSVPGRLSVWHWFGWIGTLLLVAALISELDRFLARVSHWPLPVHGIWAQFLIHPSWAAVIVFLVAPVMEELGFRAFLSAAPKLVFTGLTVLPAYLYLFIHNDFAPITAPTSPATILGRFLHAFWLIVPAGGINVLLYRHRRDAVVAFFQRRAVWVFWTSCILFGAGHNLLYTNSLVWWGFVLVMPQFVIGIGLAYLRVSFGLRWSIASHYALDLLILLPSWLYFLATPTAPLHGLLPMYSAVAVLLAVMAYGAVALRRVVRFRW
jgi:hypothetical protein